LALKPVLDSSRLEQLKSLGGPNLLGQMCGLFIENAPDRVKGVLTGWKEKDFKRIEQSAHSLKSSSGNLGAMDLMNLCQIIESAAEKSDETTLSETLVEFETMANVVLDAVIQEKKTTDE